MTEHTPGPWEYEFDDMGGYDSLSAGYHILPVKRERWIEICTVEVDDWRCGEKPDWDEYHAPNESAEADARLIAAAPDLLEALEMVVNDVMSPWYDKAREAIAKARGT